MDSVNENGSKDHRVDVIAYVTKYWDTRGIMKVSGEVISFDGRSPFFSTKNGRLSAHGKDYWLDEADAVHHVEVCKKKKIDSLLKKVDKLRSATIKVIDADKE